jgi:hypothetical protein
VIGIFRYLHYRLIGASNMPLCDNIITRIDATGQGRGSLQAGLQMSRLKPIVRVQKADSVVRFGDANQAADAARRIAVIAMISVKFNMPDILRINKHRRKAVGDKQMVAANCLTAYALDAAPQQIV